MSTIGEKIRERRIELGMTQEELAKRVGYTSRSTINKVEMSQRDVTHSMIIKYAQALHTTPSYLMGWYDEEDEKLIKAYHDADRKNQAIVRQLLDIDESNKEE